MIKTNLSINYAKSFIKLGSDVIIKAKLKTI